MDLEGHSFFFHVWSSEFEIESPSVEIPYSLKWASQESMRNIWFDSMRLDQKKISKFLYEKEENNCKNESC